MRATDIVGYVYLAELVCPSCLPKILGYGEGLPNKLLGTTEELLDAIARRIGINRDDEHTFDSDDFPKVVFDAQLDCDDDNHERCGTCGATLCGAPSPTYDTTLELVDDLGTYEPSPLD